jgi:NADH:ubiquinone oxidoreductase subunit C
MTLIKEEIKGKLKDKIKDWYEHNPKRVYIKIEPQDIKELASLFFKDLHFRFVTASGQDRPEGLEILYHFSLDKTGLIVSLRVILENKEHPEIDSIATLFPAAEWIEREMWEMLGIKFSGHPNLTRLLLAEEWPQGEFPLRHDHDHEHQVDHDHKH